MEIFDYKKIEVILPVEKAAEDFDHVEAIRTLKSLDLSENSVDVKAISAECDISPLIVKGLLERVRTMAIETLNAGVRLDLAKLISANIQAIRKFFREWIRQQQTMRGNMVGV